MTNKKIKILILATTLFLSSCATKYQPYSYFSGGYSEINMTKDSFIVNFKGNSYTDSNTALKYALIRASELTLMNGYKYFVVVSKEDQTVTSEVINTKDNGTQKVKLDTNKGLLLTSSSSTKNSFLIVKPGINLVVKCYEKQIPSNDAIDALYFLLQNENN